MYINRKKVRSILYLLVLIISIGLLINNSTTVLKHFYPLKFEDYVYKYSLQNQIDPLLVFSIIRAESSFKPEAVSRKKARGLMQITELTGHWGAESLKIEKFSIERLFEPEINIQIGCWYLGKLMKEFDNDLDLVVTAYNGGSGNVTEWLKDKNYSNSGTNLDRIPFKETEKFLKRVRNYYSTYKRLYENTF